jgi:hypothetical protein
VMCYAPMRSSWRRWRGQSLAGGTPEGSGRGDFMAEARGRGRWHWLTVQEGVVDRRAALSGGGWTRCSLEWAGDGEASARKEANDVGCFSSWRSVAPGLVT